jgi:hypothetical protein
VDLQESSLHVCLDLWAEDSAVSLVRSGALDGIGHLRSHAAVDFLSTRIAYGPFSSLSPFSFSLSLSPLSRLTWTGAEELNARPSAVAAFARVVRSLLSI